MIEYLLTGLTSFSVGGAATYILRSKIERIGVLHRHRDDIVREKIPKMVLVARTDIDMSPGKLASQCAHASLLCYKTAMKIDPKLAEYWEAVGQPKIVVKCYDNNALMKLNGEAKKAKLITALVKDAGRTQVPSGTFTVLGIGPASKEVIDKITGNLKVF